jgi:putative zinc finger protein
MSMRSDPGHPSSADLFAYRDGELPPEKRVVVEAHVMGCSLCRALMDQVSSLEAELRLSPDRNPPQYFEQLHESVSTRLKAEAAAVAAQAAQPGGVPASEDAAGTPGARRDRARRDHQEGEGGEGRLREAPRLPWAAILSTASAAAMVVVVAVFLVKQGIYQRASTPRAPSSVSQAPADEHAGEPVATRQKSDAPLKQAALRDAAKVEAKLETAKRDAGAKDKLAKRDDLIAAQRVEERAPSSAPENQVLEEDRKPSAAAAPQPSGESARGRVTLTPVREYDALLSEFGLPPVWNSSVPPEALGRAEGALRGLFVTGGAGSDSARVSLYLAEAARLRLAPGDSTLYEEIERHYRRAIDLAGQDPETARVAEQRLRSLER